MMNNKKCLILIIVGLLLIPVNFFVPDASAGSSNPSPSNGSQLGWNETLSQLCVNLSDDEGDGMEYTISQNDVVLESGGTHIYTNTTHSFNDTVNNSASWESGKGRVTSGAAFTGTTEFTSGEYSNVSNVFWDSSWDYYRIITVESDYIDSDLKNFPILVNSTDTVLISKCQANGEDIRFLSTDNSTEFYYEIERWTPGGFDVWVNISETISSSVNYTFLMYYGNAGATSQESINDVWNSDYLIVHHLNETPNDGGYFNDSTSNVNNGTWIDSSSNGDSDASGIIDGCVKFEDSASDNYVDLGSQTGFKSASFWINVPGRTDYDFVFAHSDFRVYFYTSDGEIRFSDASSHLIRTGVNIDDHFNEWVHIVAISDGTSSRIYINNVEYTDTDNFDAVSSQALNLGRWTGDSHYSDLFIEEVQVFKSVLSDDMVDSIYNSQKYAVNGSFFTIGSEQQVMGVNTSACSPTIWSHHNFSFDLSNYIIHNITGLEVRWHGYGGYYTGGAKPKWNWGTTMYFDTDASGWYTADSTTPFTTDGYDPVLEWINYSAHHEMEDWINDDGVLNVAVEHTSALDCSVIYTDYIELIVTTISGGVGNGTYCTANVSWWNDTCGTDWSWVVYTDDGRDGTSSTTYTFSNAPCTFSGTVYPTNEATDVCPCGDAICIDVTASYNFNMTIYGREQGKPYFNIWNHYENINADEYCFCMDSITPTIPAHAIGHSHTRHDVTTVGYWENVTFDHGDAEHIDCTPATGICKIEQYGHYDVRYWCVVQDNDANPTGHKMALRILQNGTDEIGGSYREVTFINQGYEKHMVGFVHEVFVPDTTLRFQFIGDDTDQSIDTDGTWSSDDINFYAEIMRMDNEEHLPLQYNTTYEWYVNVSKYDNSSLYNETSVFSFTTTSDIADCACGEVGVSGGMMRDTSGIIGLCGLFAIPITFILYQRLKKRKGSPPSGGYRNY